MNRVASLIIAIIFLCTVAVTAFAQADKLRNEVDIRIPVSVPSGEANFSGTNDPGSTLNFNRDFNFGNEVGIEVDYIYRSESGKHKFTGDFATTDWDRTRTILRSFTFRGQTYVAGAAIEGNLRQSVWKGMYAYRWHKDKLHIGPMIDMGVIPTRLDITGTTLSGGSREAEGSITKFAATVGYDLDYDPTDKINIFNNLGGIAFHHDRLFHVEGGLKYWATQHFGVLGGYKFQRYRWVNDDDFLRVSSHGPFFGGAIRF